MRPAARSTPSASVTSDLDVEPVGDVGVEGGEADEVVAEGVGLLEEAPTVSCCSPVSAKRTATVSPTAQPLLLGDVVVDGDLVGAEVGRATPAADVEVDDLLECGRVDAR